MYWKIKYLPFHIFKHMKAAHSNPKKECEIWLFDKQSPNISTMEIVALKVQRKFSLRRTEPVWLNVQAPFNPEQDTIQTSTSA